MTQKPPAPPDPPSPADPLAYAPGRLESVLMRFGTVGELMALLVRGGRWWMLPLVLILVTLGIVLVFLQAMEYFAPFIYIAI